MEDQLQHAIVDYEEAQTYPPDFPEGAAPCSTRPWPPSRPSTTSTGPCPAGLYARMLQGKSYEEKGELGAAMGLYDELMEHGGP